MYSLNSDYGKWLTDKLEPLCNEYTELLTHLFNTPYTYIYELDKNRACEGLNLRYRFSYEFDIPEEFNRTDNCSVLEMLIGLATYISENFQGSVSDWFWEFIKNLGLTKHTNGAFDRLLTDVILSIWMSHEYNRDGTGSIMPIPGTVRDLTRCELWSQLNEYLTKRGI